MNNPLTELIPAKYRKYVYLVAAAALFIYGLWEVSAGDIKAFAIALGSALVSGLAASNTPSVEEAVMQEDENEVDNGLTYEESGGLPFPSDAAEPTLYKHEDGSPDRY